MNGIKNFEYLKEGICESLCKACLIENNVQNLIEYIDFISKYGGNFIMNKVLSLNNLKFHI